MDKKMLEKIYLELVDIWNDNKRCNTEMFLVMILEAILDKNKKLKK